MSRQVDVDTDRLNELRENGYTYMEIAKKMGISISTVSRRLIKPSNTSAKKGYKRSPTHSNPVDLNGPVIKYVPEYRMEIIPETSNVEYAFKGVKFSISGDGKLAYIVSSCITDAIGTDYEKKPITCENIDCIIKVGEALVGVANYIKLHLHK